MSNSLDPDQARQFVRPDLGPNCLPKLLADDTGRQRVKPIPMLGNFTHFLTRISVIRNDLSLVTVIALLN